ncbi:MAG: NADH-quinone oxidoreductase subunit K [Flavobacterium sp.]|nr:MAG: NADH-quinone oxidoreductase subunit K [Flavobacterium sp.]
MFIQTKCLTNVAYYNMTTMFFQDGFVSKLNTFQDFTDTALFIFMLGILGILSNKKNLLMSLISIELMFFGLNLFFVISSLFLNDIAGEIASIFVLTLAAADSALALALITAFFRNYYTIVLTNAEK